MTATLLPNGRQQFIDITGKPLVAGTVGMYVVNTLVPKTTWQDADQTVLNTNPITLDSRGQATIYGNGIYRQIVRDSAGNLIWDKQTGAIGGNPLDLPTTNIVYYGGNGNGTFDNTAAFVAMDAAGGGTGGSGTFYVASNITLTGKYFFLPGFSFKPANGVVIDLSAAVFGNGTPYGVFDTSLGGKFKTTALVDPTSPSRSGSPVHVDGFGAVKNSATTLSMTANVSAFTNLFNASRGASEFDVGVGYYYLNDAITPAAAAGYYNTWNGVVTGSGRLVSNILQQDASKDIFHVLLTYNVTMEKMTLWNGVNQIYFDTDNADESMVVIKDMRFQSPTGAAINTSDDSNSTQLTVKDCVWHGNEDQTARTNYFIRKHCDYLTVTDCWATAHGKHVIENREGSINIDRFLGVGGTQASDGSDDWIICPTGSVSAEINVTNSRLSCDGGGSRRLITYQSGSGVNLGASIRFENNAIGNIDQTANVVLGSLPTYFSLRDNSKLGQINGIQIIASARTDGSILFFVQGDVKISDDYRYFTSGADKGLELAFEQRNLETACTRSQIQMSDIAYQLLSTSLAQQTVTNMTAGTAVYPYLGGATVLSLTATADDAAAFYNRSDATITGALTDNAQYTLVVDFYATCSAPVSVQVGCCGQNKTAALVNGLSVICVPFTWFPSATGVTRQLLVQVNSMASGDVLLVGRTRILVGRYDIDDTRTIVNDASGATIANVAWNIGDQWIYTAPASGAIWGTQCTTAGTGGAATFKAIGTLA